MHNERPTTTLIRADHLLDGTGGPAIHGAAVVVDGDRIAFVGAQAVAR